MHGVRLRHDDSKQQFPHKSGTLIHDFALLMASEKDNAANNILSIDWI
jgi:hypothetical protein